DADGSTIDEPASTALAGGVVTAEGQAPSARTTRARAPQHQQQRIKSAKAVESETADIEPAPSAAAKAPRQPRARQAAKTDVPAELPERMSEGRVSGDAAEASLVRRPQIGDTRPAPKPAVAPKTDVESA